MYRFDRQSSDIMFVLTVDTEEEWHWDGPFPEKHCLVENVQQIPAFQSFCEEIGIRPTYFVDYAVADNPKAVESMRVAVAKQQCEIGAHLHPWCNPPYFGTTGEKESHVVNLPIEQTQAKLDNLVDVLYDKFNVYPRSFRTGRWGIDGKVLRLLAERGFTVDSSVYPYYKNEFFSCEDAPVTPYWPDFDNPNKPGSQRQMMEIPVTAGFNRSNYETAHQIHKLGERPPFSSIRLVGMLWHTHLLRKIYLSPELTDENNLCTLIDSAVKRGNKVIHMYLHSSSLIDGATGLFTEQNALQVICQRIKHAVSHLQNISNVNFCTINEAAALLKVRNEKEACLI